MVVFPPSGTSSRSRIEEAGEGVGEVGQVIAFGALGPDSHDARVDPEWLEPAGQPTQCGGQRGANSLSACEAANNDTEAGECVVKTRNRPIPK